MNRLVLVPVLFMLIIGCETIGQTKNSSNGTTLKVYNNKKIIMKTIVTVLTEDGYKINNIYGNYGIISAASNKIPTSEVMKKADEPGVDFFSSSIMRSQPPMSTIEISANVSSKGVIEFKASVFDEKERQIDYQLSSKLTDYYVNTIKKRLTEQ